MYDEITTETYERVSHLICEYARMCNRTNREVAHALLASKTLRRRGYRHDQKGRLTEDQGKAAVRVLDYWIRSRTIEHQQS